MLHDDDRNRKYETAITNVSYRQSALTRACMRTRVRQHVLRLGGSTCSFLIKATTTPH